ncbi:MAG: anhydro-N-acetylmuramic acid kinase [Chlorobiota bacterium]|nr:anhydro-N-acetylmuramic acid kinase [Chlorobiota bacterium]QQS67047.1 MAG: anhydro-N-acetylmuramic acid kinase [Chlorobiota bacterium]
MSKLINYRNKVTKVVVGVMSGTSLDAIDVAFVEISNYSINTKHKLIAFKSIPIESSLKDRLHAACEGNLTMRECFELDIDLGMIYVDSILDCAKTNNLSIDMIDAIGLHGQTVFHNPNRKPIGLTIQIGSGSVVAQNLATIVVNDFRTNDVAAGGHGAPLVPYCDYLLLHDKNVNKVSLNIGGISNITWLGKNTTLDNLIAFDTGPGNMIIDSAMLEFYNKKYDENGDVALTGQVNEEWLTEILSKKYYHLKPPKSTGREQFGEETSKALTVRGRSIGLSNQDIISTITAVTSRSIAMGINNFCRNEESVDEIIIGGGGFHNSAIIKYLKGEFVGTTFSSSDKYNLPVDAKESICFAILANETLNEIRSNVPNVTGAKNHVICGSIRIG